MLNYMKKNTSFVITCVTLVMSIIFLIVFDFLILNSTEKIYSAQYKINDIEFDKYENVQTNARKSMDSVDINDVLLELMQVADIYEGENILVEQITQEDNENQGQDNANNTDNTQQGVQIEETNEVERKQVMPTWRIEIPKIGVNAPIKSGTSQEVLATAVGHFEESVEWNGNVALAGHNRGYNCNFFQNIKNLKNGDKIIYYTEYGKRVYEVVTNKIIKQTDWSYIENTEDNRITLITCVENMYEYRRCIQAVECI